MKDMISRTLTYIRTLPLKLQASHLKKSIARLEKSIATEKQLAQEFTEESLRRRKRRGAKIHDGSPATSVIDTRMIFALDETKRFQKKAQEKKEKLAKVETRLSSM